MDGRESLGEEKQSLKSSRFVCCLGFLFFSTCSKCFLGLKGLQVVRVERSASDAPLKESSILRVKFLLSPEHTLI